MVFGCYYPYMSFCGYPGWYGGGWYGNTEYGYNRASYINGVRNAVRTAATFPYGFSTNIGGIQAYGQISSNLSPEDAYDVNRMINDPSYIPSPRINFTPYNQTEEARRNAEIKLTSNKISLDVEYRSLCANLNDYLTQLDNFVAQTPNLTDEQKQKLEAKKQEALALQKRVEEFAKNSADKNVSDALNEIVGMRNEYYKLRDESIALNRQIMSELSNAGNAGNAGGAGDAGNADGAGDAGNADGAGDAGNSNPIDNMTGQELLENYEDEIKPKIDTLKQSDKLTDADKKAIDDKQKELEKAIADGKTEEEIRPIEKELEKLVKGGEVKAGYQTDVKPQVDEVLNNDKLSEEDKKDIQKKQKALENAISKNRDLGRVAELAEALDAAVEAAKAKLKENETTQEDENYVKQVEASKKVIENARKDMKDVGIYVPYSSRQDLANLIDLLNKAIEGGKPANEINKLRAQVESLALNLKNDAIKRKESADKIAGAIYEAADGTDWHWDFWNRTDAEQKIIDNVNKINGKNVFDVINRWDEAYKKESEDDCILQTIYAEFATDTEEKGKMTDIILNALVQYAKSIGVHDKISGYVTQIKAKYPLDQGFGYYGTIYRAFNAIMAELRKAQHVEIPESLESSTSSDSTSGGVR